MFVATDALSRWINSNIGLNDLLIELVMNACVSRQVTTDIEMCFPWYTLGLMCAAGLILGSEKPGVTIIGSAFDKP